MKNNKALDMMSAKDFNFMINEMLQDEYDFYVGMAYDEEKLSKTYMKTDREEAMSHLMRSESFLNHVASIAIIQSKINDMVEAMHYEG